MTMTTQIAELKTQSRAMSAGILNPANLAEALTMAETISKSSLVPKDYQGNPGNVLVAIQWGMEVGLGPLQAMQNIAVINGRPSLWGDALLALCKASPVCEYIQETMVDDTAICTAKRRGDPAPVIREFSMEDAKRAGLAGKQGPWTQYPKRMLQMRARGYCLRDTFPDVLKGMAVAEEEQDKPKEVMGTVETSGPAHRPTSRTAELKAKINESLIKAGAMPADLSPPPDMNLETGEVPDNGVTVDMIKSAIAAASNADEVKELTSDVKATNWPDETKKEIGALMRARIKALGNGD
jgi:hypothetical protein